MSGAVKRLAFILSTAYIACWLAMFFDTTIYIVLYSERLERILAGVGARW